MPAYGAIIFNGRNWHPQEFASCMAMDAFRLALGTKPRNFSREEILTWLSARQVTA